MIRYDGVFRIFGTWDRHANPSLRGMMSINACAADSCPSATKRKYTYSANATAEPSFSLLNFKSVSLAKYGSECIGTFCGGSTSFSLLRSTQARTSPRVSWCRYHGIPLTGWTRCEKSLITAQVIFRALGPMMKSYLFLGRICLETLDDRSCGVDGKNVTTTRVDALLSRLWCP